MVNIQNLIADAKCFETVRGLHWSDGIFCPHGGSVRLIKRGFDDTQPYRQRYHCHGCDRDFDDLTGTVLAGHHQPLRVWILCLYFMGLNLSNRQIAQELGLNKEDAQHMTTHLRQGLVAQQEPAPLHGAVECDEVYIVAGHKGHPTAVKKRTKRTTQSTQRWSGTWHLSRRKTADLGPDSTRRGCVHSDDGECPAKNH